MTEYLNSIYFGEGAYGIEAAAKTYFGSASTAAAARSRARTTVRVAASALGVRDARRDHLLPQRLLAPGEPRRGPGAAQPGAPEHGGPRLHHADRVPGVLRRSRSPSRATSSRRRRTPTPPTSPRGCASSSSTSTAPARRSAAASTVNSTLDLDFQQQVAGDRRQPPRGHRAHRLGRRARQRRPPQVRAMVGGNDFDKEPFNLATNGHRQPGSSFKPFTLVTALEQGRSPEEVFASQPKEFPFVIKAPQEERRLQEGQRPLRGQQLRRQLPRLRLHRHRAPPTPTTPSTPSSGSQVGAQNVAATAKKMGIDTDLSTENEYSIDGGPFEPYNPALILGGLEVGVTPLEMAHAYKDAGDGRQRVSGHARGLRGRPRRHRRGRRDQRRRRPATSSKTADGSEGKDQCHRRPGDLARGGRPPRSAILETVVQSGTGENAATEEPTCGKTGTTDDNGDAWFCGATDEITACVWVGHADSVTPMETEYAGAAGRRRHLPGADLPRHRPRLGGAPGRAQA